MEKYKLTEQQKKIVDGLEKAYIKLIAFKRKMKSDMVIMKDDKIIRVKP